MTDEEAQIRERDAATSDTHAAGSPYVDRRTLLRLLDEARAEREAVGSNLSKLTADFNKASAQGLADYGTISTLTADLAAVRAERDVWQNKWRHYKDRCQEAGVGVSELRAERTRREALEAALRSMPCGCITYGRSTIPSHPDDFTHTIRCARCAALASGKT